MDDRPLILCSNDDGFSSLGLVMVTEALASFARVVVVAPETEQSATSHSLTLHRPLRLRRIEEDRFALDGTPADCVYLALHLPFPDLLPRRPDLVISGINRGPNLGQDVFYSGTVAAAREGALRGIPALAASVDLDLEEGGATDYDPQPMAQLVASLAKVILRRNLVGGTERKIGGNWPWAPLFNLNAPAGPIRGVRPTGLGNRIWEETVESRRDPRGRAYYWIGGRGIGHDPVPGSDTEAHDAGYASLTMLALDLGRHDPESARLLELLLTDIRPL